MAEPKFLPGFWIIERKDKYGFIAVVRKET